MSSQTPPKGLLTDVFGTVVDWRTTVTEYLEKSAHETLNSASASIPSAVRLTIDTVSWPEFAQKWRNSYYAFTRGYDPEIMPYKSVDDHHLESLHKLLREYSIDGLWTEQECIKHSRIWHYLTPWPDSSPGIERLSRKLKVATLSNGNQSLLNDLDAHGNLHYTHIISAEDFKAYKPHPRVYQGGCNALSLKPEECAMVAAHLNDLQAAKGQGMQTIYIERRQEEAWDASQIEEAKGWVDMWIREDEGGFEEIANRLSCY